MRVKYVKITNKNETHNGFVYRDGLNKLLEPFDDDPFQSCVPGGLYFTNIQNIHKYHKYGIYIRKISLPKNDPDFKIIADLSGDKFRANKIILGERYSLCDPKTYGIFNIKLPSIRFLVECAIEENNINCLNTLQKLYFTNDPKIELYFKRICYSHIYDIATSENKIDILQWAWNNYPSILPTDIINHTARRGNLDIFKWAHNKKYPYDEKLYIYAIKNNHYDIIKWADKYNYKWCAPNILNVPNEADEKIFEWLSYNKYYCNYECICSRYYVK